MNTCKHLLLVCMLLCSMHVYAHQKPPVAEKEYYTFLNDFFREKNIAGSNLLADANALEAILADTARLFRDSSFSSADIGFMRQQIAYAFHYKWKKGHIPGVRIIAHKKVMSYFGPKHKGDGWQKFYKHHYANGYASYAVPLFSLDRQTCIFYYGYHCGWLCGHGVLCIYKKAGNKWMPQGNVSSWVS